MQPCSHMHTLPHTQPHWLMCASPCTQPPSDWSLVIMALQSLGFYYINCFEKGRESERERKRNIHQLPHINALIRDWTCNLGTCPHQKWARDPSVYVWDDAPANWVSLARAITEWFWCALSDSSRDWASFFICFLAICVLYCEISARIFCFTFFWAISLFLIYSQKCFIIWWTVSQCQLCAANLFLRFVAGFLVYVVF